MSKKPSSRADQIQNFLAQNDLDAWISWRPDELVMLSGYLPFWGTSLLINFASSAPVLFVPVLEPRDHIPAGLSIKEYPWGDLRCADPYSLLISGVAEELAKAKARPERVGMSTSASRSSLPIQAGEQIPHPENFASLFSALAHKVDIRSQSAFASLYLQKTAEEIEKIRRANMVANVGLKAFSESLQPGISEAEIAAAVESAIYRQIGRDGIFHSRGWAMVQSGPNSADSGRFNRSSGRLLENGDLVLIELATCVDGYWSDLTRTAAIGRTKLVSTLALVNKAQQAAIEGIRPGVSAAHIDALARDEIDDQGLARFFTHHTGHHVGFRYHDPGFVIRPGEASMLEPGMVITIEPGIYLPERGGGARTEDDVLVTESGHEVLSRIDENELRSWASPHRQSQNP